MRNHHPDTPGRSRTHPWWAARTLLIIGAAIAMLTSTGTTIAGPAAALTRSATDAPSIRWGPVTPVWDHGAQYPLSVTTDNGMVVAAWDNYGPSSLWISVRTVGHSWSQPTNVATDAPIIDLVKDGDRALVLWQGTSGVFTLQVGADGAIGTPHRLGPSFHRFIADAQIATGSSGAMAAVWHARTTVPLLTYGAPGGQWTRPEPIPTKGDIVALVVGGGGNVELVLSNRQQITYLRRTAAGVWSAPHVVASRASLPSAIGDQRGDLVVGWQEHSSNGYSLYARYRPAEAGFGRVHLLGAGVPYGVGAALAMADSGAVAAAYQVNEHGPRQIQVTRADRDGVWSGPQTLPLAGPGYGIAMNAAGDFVVVSQDYSVGIQLVRCGATSPCGRRQTNPATGYRFPSTTLGPGGTITLLWGRGCKTEECFPTSLVAQRGR